MMISCPFTGPNLPLGVLWGHSCYRELHAQSGRTHLMECPQRRLRTDCEFQWHRLSPVDEAKNVVFVSLHDDIASGAFVSHYQNAACKRLQKIKSRIEER